jgi:hypothetical protein
MRKLFAQISVNCEPSNPAALWDKHKTSLSEDILHVSRSRMNKSGSYFINDYSFNLCLQYIEMHLTRYGKSLKSIPGMPLYNENLAYDNTYDGDLIAEELNYDAAALNAEFKQNYPLLNDD